MSWFSLYGHLPIHYCWNTYLKCSVIHRQNWHSCIVVCQKKEKKKSYNEYEIKLHKTKWNVNITWNEIICSNLMKYFYGKNKTKKTHMMAHTMTKTLFNFGDAGKITDTIGFEACIKRFLWVTTFCRHFDLPANSCDNWTYSLENVKAVLKNVQNKKVIEKNCKR